MSKKRGIFQIESVNRHAWRCHHCGHVYIGELENCIREAGQHAAESGHAATVLKATVISTTILSVSGQTGGTVANVPITAEELHDAMIHQAIWRINQ